MPVIVDTKNIVRTYVTNKDNHAKIVFVAEDGKEYTQILVSDLQIDLMIEEFNERKPGDNGR